MREMDESCKIITEDMLQPTDVNSGSPRRR